jgi:tetratricopeptide (TPR) repeat protein
MQYVTQTNRKKFGDIAPQTIAAICDEAKKKSRQGFSKDAKAMIEKALSAKGLGAESRLLLLETKYDLLFVCNQETSKEAKLPLLKEVTALSGKVRGLSDEKSDQWRYKLLDEYKSANALPEAEKYMLWVIAEMQKTEGPDSQNAAEERTTLCYWVYKNEPKKAIRCMDQAIKTLEKIKKPMPSFLVSNMLTSQAQNYRAIKDYAASEALYKRAIKIYETMKFEQPLLQILPKYAEMLKEAGKNAESQAVATRSRAIFDKYKHGCGIVVFEAGGDITEW